MVRGFLKRNSKAIRHAWENAYFSKHNQVRLEHYKAGKV